MKKAREILYIKKSDIELSIGLIKNGNQFIPQQSTPLLEALNIALKVLEDKIISEIWEHL